MSIGSVVAIDSGDVGNSANLESFDNKELNIINEKVISTDNHVDTLSANNQVEVPERDLDANSSSENISVEDSNSEENNVNNADASLYLPATLGLSCTIVLFPIITFVRWITGKAYKDVQY